MIIRIISIYIVLTVMISASIALAGENSTDMHFGIRAGLFGEGSVDVGNRSFSTESGLCGGIFWDFQVMNKTYLGLAVDIAEIGNNDINLNEHLLNLSLEIKRRFNIENKDIYFRPGIAIGYAFLNEIPYVDLKDSRYITFRGFAEMIAPLNEKSCVFADFGLFWCPSGGDGDIDVTGGPFLQLRLGFVFK
ncbi:MAG: hypothetical protein ABIJ45_10550 [Candidatus Zixiibacteriota bacterium]